MSSQKTSWKGTPVAERRVQRKAALISATLQIVGDSGTSAVTTKGVSAHAGMIERYVYESFSSRDDLLRSTFDDALKRGIDAMSEAFGREPHLDFSARTRRVLETVLDLIEREPGLYRIVFVDAAVDPVLRDRHDALHANLEAFCRTLLTEDTVDIRDDDEIQVVVISAVGAAISLLTAWMSGRLTLDRDRLLDATVDVLQTLIPATASQSSAHR